jgi:hypothetical protein
MNQQTVNAWQDAVLSESRQVEITRYDIADGASIQYELILNVDSHDVFATFGSSRNECVALAAKWCKEHPDG